MRLEESIMHAIDGNAVLFLGAGFNSGAINFNDERFPLGNELCQRIIEDGNIDVSEDSEKDKEDLQYISERYLENNTKTDLINFLKKQFTCKKLSDAQKIISSINWKRIYTTNYDDTIEYASKIGEVQRDSIDPKKNYADVLRKKGAIIHINGYIGNVTEDDLDDTFKLLDRSYQRRTIPDSDIALTLSNDIKNAQCFIFIGYSLDYDLELQQIFVEGGMTKNKSVFITYNASNRTKHKIEKFGTLADIGIDEFANRIKDGNGLYKPKIGDYRLKLLNEMKSEDYMPSTSISDNSMTELFLKGNIKMENILDEIVLLLGKQARTASILKNVQINEFLDFDNNRLKLKSSVVAEYILHNMDYNDDVELIVSKIILVLNAHNHISRYEHMLRMIVSYSNLRMLFNRKEKSYSERITKIYEIAKSLEYFKENPFFWLQYAIAKMEVHDYQAAQIYLDNAESFRKKKHVTDSWQIDTIKGRFLLEKTMYDNNAKYAYENFDMAYHYLHDNNTTDIQYPLRQVSLFDKYYRQFYDGFSNSERNVFLMHCIDMQKLIKKNISSVGKMNTRELIRIDKMLTKIQNEMAKKSV